MASKKAKSATAEIAPVSDGTGGPFDLSRALEGLRGRRAALIYMHDNPDPDSLASAMGLQLLLAHEIGCETTLALGGIIGRAENRAMVEQLGIPLVALEKLDRGRFDCVAIVDSQPGTGNNSIAAGQTVDIVVDHHARHPQCQAAWCDIRDRYGATTTLILQYLRERAIPLDARLATGMFYALRTETRDLGRESGTAERDAYLHLVPLVDHTLLHRIVHPKVPRAHFAGLDRALRSAKVYGDMVAANLDELAYPDLVAEIADLLLSLDGARFALCAGRYRGKVYVSLRTDLSFHRAGWLMRQIIASDGAAGGHGTMAGGSFHAKVPGSDELAAVFATLIARIHAALERPVVAGESLVG